MSTVQANPSHNGHGSAAWACSWTGFRVDRRSTRYCRVTFVSSVTPTTVAELGELVGLIEHDADLHVVVFASANRDVFLTDHDVRSDPAWIDVLARVARAPVVTIAAIRGGVGRAGSEFVLACDLRFAARENTTPGQFDVGVLLVADDDLDDEVDAIASRLASFGA